MGTQVDQEQTTELVSPYVIVFCPEEPHCDQSRDLHFMDKRKKRPLGPGWSKRYALHNSLNRRNLLFHATARLETLVEETTPEFILSSSSSQKSSRSSETITERLMSIYADSKRATSQETIGGTKSRKIGILSRLPRVAEVPCELARESARLYEGQRIND